MAAITLNQIRSDVRSRVSDEEMKLSSGVLTHWANIAQDVIYNQLLPILSIKMVQRNIISIAIIGGKYSFTIPANREIKRVLIAGKKARRKTFDEIDSVMEGFEAATTANPVYLEWGNTIEIFPVEGFTVENVIELFSLKQIVPMIEDSSTPSIPEEYHGLIVDYVEAMALRKLGRVDAAINVETMQAKMYGDILGGTAQQIMLEDAKKERT